LNPGFRSSSLLTLSLAACSIAAAQATPTAIQRITIYGFGAATGTYTGLDGGKNLGITAGADIGFRPFHSYYPYLEVRGTYPVDDGHVDAQKTILYGLKVARFYGHFHPYVNLLFGRDKIDYQDGGYPNAAGTLLFINSVSNVFSVGGGLDLDITDQIALKLDGQFQRIGVPVNASGDIYSKPLSVGIAYRFDFNHHIHYNRDGSVKGYKPPPPPKPEVVQQPPDTAAPTDNTPAPDNSVPPPAPDNTAPATGTSNPPPADTSTPPAKPSPDTPAPNPPSTQQPQ
jgi:opacity protein-like surface antigen